MGEEKKKLDSLRAKRGGHRTVVTKNINEARTILEHTDLEDIMWSRLNVVEQILDEKLILLAGFDEKITKKYVQLIISKRKLRWRMKSVRGFYRQRGKSPSPVLG